MEQLIVRLGSEVQDPIHWIVWSTQEQEIIASGELPNADHLSSLQERAGARPVIALAPSSDILLKWVTLPARANRKVIAAIPYMLEEELSSDVSEQFFALGPKKADRQAVAIASKNQMKRWQAMLDSAGLVCDKLIPDVLTLPVNENGWSLLALGSHWLIRQDLWSGLQGEPDWLLPAISHYAKQQEDPLTIYDYSGADVVIPPNVEWSTQTIDMPMHTLVTGCLSTDINLLQGEFKQKRRGSNQWSKWRLAAILATVALLLTVIDKAVTLSSLNNEKAQLSAQIDEDIKRGFPNVTTYRDAKRTLTRELAKLEQGGGGVSMLVMLNQLTPAFSQTNVKPQTLRFDGERGELRIQATAPNFESLESFRNQAELAGYEVEQGAINNRDNQVVGSIAIKG